MKYVLFILLAFSFNANAQERIDLKDYGINATLDTKGLELYSLDSTAKSSDAQKVVIVELEGLHKLSVLWLHKGKTASKELAAIAGTIKQKKLKLALQEKNVIIVEQKGTFKLFYATVVKGNQYFMQSNLCTKLEDAQQLLAIAKSLE